MGYNLTNARNGMSALKIAKWASLGPLELKSRFIQRFQFSENLEDMYGICCWESMALLSNNLFLTNPGADLG